MILYKPWQFIFFICLIVLATILSIPSSERLGMIYFDSYQYDKALVYFKKVNSLNENNIPTLKKLKEYFLIKGSVEEALEVQKKLCALRPKNVEYLVELEKLYDWSQKPSQKLATMRKRAELLSDENKRSLYVEILNGYRWLRDYQSADEVAKYIMVDPILKTSQNLVDQVIEYFLATRKSEEAIHLLEIKILQSPDDQKSLEWLSESYRFQGDFLKSIEILLRLLGSNERKLNIVDQIKTIEVDQIKRRFNVVESIIDGLIKSKQHKQVQEVREYLFKIFPEDPEIRFALAETYYSNKEIPQALEMYLSLFTVKDDLPKYLYQAALRLREVGKIQDALRFMEKLIKFYPDVITYLEFLGDLYEQNGEKRKAIETYFKILELKKRRTFLEARNLYALNSEIPFVPDFKTLKIHPLFRKDTQVQRVKNKILNVVDHLDSVNEKFDVLNRLVENSPNDLAILKRLGYAHFEADNPEGAYKVFEHAYRIDPSDLDIVEVLLRKDLENRDVESASMKLGLLTNQNNYFDLNEEFLFIKDKEEHQAYCQQFILNSQNSILEKEVRARCHFRTNNFSEARMLIEDLKKTDDSNIRYNFMLLSSCLELKDIACSVKQIELLKRLGIQESVLLDYERYLEEIKAYLKREFAWVSDLSLGVSNYKEWSVFRESLEIDKRYSNWSLGLEAEHIHYSAKNDYSWMIFDPNIKIESTSTSLQIGPRIIKSKMTQRTGLLKLSSYSQRNYFSLEVNGASPIVEKRELVEAQAMEQLVNFYGEEKVKNRFILSQGLKISKVKTNSIGSGNLLNIRGDVLYKFINDSNFYLGPLIGYSSFDSDNSDLRSQILEKSLLYGPSLLYRRMRSLDLRGNLEFIGRVDVLGDDKRDLNIGQVIILYGEVSYTYNVEKKIGFSLFGGRETVANIDGTNWGARINWLTWW
ncbi:MAG: hypothetical protein Fur0010_09420 [Bdellovibrio sp.]